MFKSESYRTEEPYATCDYGIPHKSRVVPSTEEH